ncbi:sodium/pantothenate symporter [Hymenobacter sp. BT491]|uniref:sodium/pantothenate symporter n=1 Tax=Hymenobacter sp. BT491 TaxID=2766779 RepID=UPI001653EC42|nr:sodium:solute symporter [Hymenobacter sp. BT491]MBC6989009.1 sodium:solute symporter [Hymenobacter sp. BT491]
MNGIASSQTITATAILLLVYAGLTLFFVVRGARRTGSMADYAVGSVNFSPVAVGLSLAASMTSAATFIINPGFVALYGLSGVLSFGIVMPLAAFVSLIVLTKGFRKHGQTVKALTMAQWMGSRYQSPFLTRYFAVLSLLLITFIVLICVGITRVLSQALDVQPVYVLVGLVVFVFGYMMFGGANSMVYTNTLQVGLKLVVAFVLLGSGYRHFSEGVHGFLAKLSAIDPALVHSVNPQSYFFRDYFEIIFCQIIVGIAIVCQPHTITKSLLLKSDKDVNRYLLTAVVVLTLFFMVVFTGLYARLAFPNLMVNGQALKMDAIIPAYVLSEFPVYLTLLVVLGLAASGISTLEGLIQSLSTTITADLIRPAVGEKFFSSQAGHRREIIINRSVIVLLAVVSILLSYNQITHPNLSVAVFAQNGVYAYFAAAFIPVFFGILFKDAPRMAVVAASIVAIGVHFTVYYAELTPYMHAPVKNPGVPAALAILSSALVGSVLFIILRRNKQNEPVYSGRSPSAMHALADDRLS